MSQFETVRPSKLRVTPSATTTSRPSGCASWRRPSLPARARSRRGSDASRCGWRSISAAGPATRPRCCTRRPAPRRRSASTTRRDSWRARGGRAPRGVAFGEHDIAQVPFPAPPADLIYGRFIVTHLSETGAAIARWADAIAPRGTAGAGRGRRDDVGRSDARPLLRAGRGDAGGARPADLRRPRSSRAGARGGLCRRAGRHRAGGAARRPSPRGCTRSTSGPGGRIRSSSATSTRRSSIASANRWRRWPPARARRRRCAGKWRR